MKRCPTCNRTFEDDALSFCLHDGAGLVTDVSAASPPPELQATMMAVPPPISSSNFSSSGSSSGPASGSGSGPGSGAGLGSGSYNPPSNPTWVTPATPPPNTPPKSGGMNKKLIFAGVGCLGLAGIVVIVSIILMVSFSGASSKMSPYKGDLKELVPETVGSYKRIDVDVLGDRDKRNFGKVGDALGVTYKGTTESTVRMFVGNYTSAKDAEDGLKSFKDEIVSDGFTLSNNEKKKIGWRTVGIRYLLAKTISTGRNGEQVLPDGATLVRAQESSSPAEKRRQFVGWTNGSVVYVMAGEGTDAVDFEKVFDKEVK